MKTSTAIIVLIVIVLLGGGAYYWYAGQGTMSPSGTAGLNGSPNQGNLGGTDTGTPQQPTGPATLNTSSSATLGAFLTGANGMTLYEYANDTAGVSNCIGQCAANWPPYTVASPTDISVPASITGSMGTIVRADGTFQVTYNDAPLYFYGKDTAPGQTNGQGVGGVWSVAKP